MTFLHGRQGCSSVGLERFSHIEEVIGSSPIIPTEKASFSLAFSVGMTYPIFLSLLAVLLNISFCQKVFGDLDGIGGGAFAEIVGDAPEIEGIGS